VSAQVAAASAPVAALSTPVAALSTPVAAVSYVSIKFTPVAATSALMTSSFNCLCVSLTVNRRLLRR